MLDLTRFARALGFVFLGYFLGWPVLAVLGAVLSGALDLTWSDQVLTWWTWPVPVTFPVLSAALLADFLGRLRRRRLTTSQVGGYRFVAFLLACGAGFAVSRHWEPLLISGLCLLAMMFPAKKRAAGPEGRRPMRPSRGRRAPVTTARAALKDSIFACSTPGVAAVHVDYDPAVWVRAPKPGQDRTDWVEAHLAAFASDLDLDASDDLYQHARIALDLVADDAAGHTCDFVSLQGQGQETGVVAYVNVVDEQLGLLEHGEPEAFVTMADLAAQGGTPQRPQYFPTRRQPRSWRVSDVQSLAPGSLATTWLRRAYRCIEPDGVRSAVHLYAGGFHSQPESGAAMLHLFTRVDVQLEDPRG
ncbi:hypothetical protein DQ237_05925 [Blastococcus sp. TF02-8]|uniref:hypothetical protein n=1 Tax=Blastococcus sp. TF02-8 TaxID=2250574 RepID=UPI000DE95724|nr:hypothetical protein [Blastococcus sp. TF02-8]RBY97115.1 hypothetical protein DQ237_05925 [Blastococcus sp. TF02-8]